MYQLERLEIMRRMRTANTGKLKMIRYFRFSTFNRIATYNNISPDLTAVNNATIHSMINVFTSINGRQGALTADTYNIYFVVLHIMMGLITADLNHI
jgi:hypothetical protein